jgi:hypothetical protein
MQPREAAVDPLLQYAYPGHALGVTAFAR